MDRSAHLALDPAVRTLDRELDLVESAITMVVSGGARRVRVGGLRFGEQLLGQAGRMALEAGVRLVPLWKSGDAGVDLAVERVAGVTE